MCIGLYDIVVPSPYLLRCTDRANRGSLSLVILSFDHGSPTLSADLPLSPLSIHESTSLLSYPKALPPMLQLHLQQPITPQGHVVRIDTSRMSVTKIHGQCKAGFPGRNEDGNFDGQNHMVQKSLCPGAFPIGGAHIHADHTCSGPQSLSQ